MDVCLNPFAERIDALVARARRRRLSAVLVCGETNVRSLTDVACDNACLVVRASGETVLLTDFRYVPAVRRTAPWLKVVDAGRDLTAKAAALAGSGACRIGYEGSIPTARFLRFKKMLPKATFVDVADEIAALRAVKTILEIAKLAAAAALNDAIWKAARRDFHPGMTEKDIQRVIRAHMNARGDGEAFETIVCAGANAAECHHVPDDTVWRRGDPLLVDMGVKLDGFCSDMTRCIPAARDSEYARIYELVLSANRAAIAACRPGITCGALDKVARDIIRKAGYGKAFGHALGHGVGYDIHEAPTARSGSDTVLEPGMFVTIEPGVYLPGSLGVRIEDLVLVTDTGCDVLSASMK